MNKTAERVCEALRIQQREYQIIGNQIKTVGLTFTIEPDLNTDAPTKCSLSFLTLNTPGGTDNALYPPLFLMDHFGNNCQPDKIMTRSTDAIRKDPEHPEYSEKIGDWTLRLSIQGDSYVLEVF